MTVEQQRAQESFNFLASQFPSLFNAKGSLYLRALLLALSKGDGFISSQLEAVRDNLFVLTATGKHLDRLASGYGIVRDVGTGIQDDDFRKLVPVLGMSPKQIQHTLLQIIDAIYGPYASHANVTCSAPATYYIEDGSHLKVLVDGEILNIYFKSTDFNNYTQATAKEVATAISDRTGGKLVGSVISNTRTGEKFVNIRTNTLGSQGFVKVLGGPVQAALKFPEIRPTTQAITTWEISHYNGSDEMTYTIVGGTDPMIKGSGVRNGDYVTIRNDSGLDLRNCGTFLVTGIGNNYFRCRNAEGAPETATNLNLDDFTFFKPDTGNVLLSARPAAVIESGLNEVTILLPVTSPIVKRSLKGGHHFHGSEASALSTTSSTVTLSNTDGFDSSGAIKPMVSRPYNKAVCSSVGATSITLIDASNFPTSGAVYSASERTFYYYDGLSGNVLLGVTPAPASALAGTTLKYTERYLYTGKSGNDLTGVYPDPSNINGLEVVQAGASLDDGYVGSFIYDPDASFVAGESLTRIDENIVQSSSLTALKVEDCTSFPDSGFFVLEYGTTEQEGPIRYLGKLGDNNLIVDPSHLFERDHTKGVGLRLVRQLGPVLPRNDGSDYAVYLASTSPALDLVVDYIRVVVAAGVTVKFVINVPDQKWPIPYQLYSSDPMNTELV
jgi:hypothetical protein